MEMLERLGPKWSKIVQRLPGRTVSSVRNRWQRIDKGRRLREAGHESKNRCQQCGKPKRGHVCMARLKNRGEGGELAAMALKQWEDSQVPEDAPEGEEGNGEEGKAQAPVPVSRSSSAPAYLEGHPERKYDRGHASLENAVRAAPRPRPHLTSSSPTRPHKTPHDPTRPHMCGPHVASTPLPAVLRHDVRLQRARRGRRGRAEAHQLLRASAGEFLQQPGRGLEPLQLHGAYSPPLLWCGATQRQRRGGVARLEHVGHLVDAFSGRRGRGFPRQARV